MEGRGQAVVYAGGWSDYQAQKAGAGDLKTPEKAAEKTKPKKESSQPASQSNKSQGLSFTERHRLEALPAEIDRLTAEIAKLEEFMADPDLFHKEPVKFQKATEALVERQAALAAGEEEWMELEEKAEQER